MSLDPHGPAAPAAKLQHSPFSYDVVELNERMEEMPAAVELIYRRLCERIWRTRDKLLADDDVVKGGLKNPGQWSRARRILLWLEAIRIEGEERDADDKIVHPGYIRIDWLTERLGTEARNAAQRQEAGRRSAEARERRRLEEEARVRASNNLSPGNNVAGDLGLVEDDPGQRDGNETGKVVAVPFESKANENPTVVGVPFRAGDKTLPPRKERSDLGGLGNNPTPPPHADAPTEGEQESFVLKENYRVPDDWMNEAAARRKELRQPAADLKSQANTWVLHHLDRRFTPASARLSWLKWAARAHPAPERTLPGDAPGNGAAPASGGGTPEERPPEPYAGHFTRTEYAQWIEPCDIVVVDDEAMVLAPSKFVADWIRQRLEQRLCAARGVARITVDVATPQEAARG